MKHGITSLDNSEQFVIQFNDEINNRLLGIVGPLDLLAESNTLLKSSAQETLNSAIELINKLISQLTQKLANNKVLAKFDDEVKLFSKNLMAIKALLSEDVSSLLENQMSQLRKIIQSLKNMSIKFTIEGHVKRAEETEITPSAEIKKIVYEPLHLRILVVEDNAFNQKIILRMLRELLSCECKIANNGQEAVDFYQQDFDIVLMDINMPIKNGLEATKEILKKSPKAKIIGLSAGDYEKQGREIGMIDFLSKPYKVEILFRILAPHSTAASVLKKIKAESSISLSKSAERGELLYSQNVKNMQKEPTKPILPVKDYRV